MGIEIKIYEDGNLVAELAALAESCMFELGAYGCGPCAVVLREKWRQDRGARRGQDLRVFDAGGNLLWRGEIRRAVKRLGGDRLQLDAAGYAWPLRELALQAADANSYSGLAPEAIAQELFEDVVQPQIPLAAFTADASGATLNSFVTAEGQDCWSLLDRLAAAAGGFYWGVDEQLNLFFRNPNTFSSAPLHRFELGGDVLELLQIEDDRAVNDLLIDGAAFQGRFQHAASLAAFGPRFRRVDAPQISGTADAQLLADGIFARMALPPPLRVIRARAPQAALKPWTGKFAVRDPQREAEGFVAHTFGSVRTILLAPGLSAPLVELTLGARDRAGWPDPFALPEPFPRSDLNTVFAV